MAGVISQVGHDLVASWVALRVARERQARKAAVADRREELQRVPAPAPGRRELLASLEDDEVLAVLGEEVAHREPGLARSDHDHVVTMRDGVHRSPRCL